jgi:hypothetical protein
MFRLFRGIYYLVYNITSEFNSSPKVILDLKEDHPKGSKAAAKHEPAGCSHFKRPHLALANIGYHVSF